MGGNHSEEEPAEWKGEQKAKYIWRSGAFAGEFGDPFIKDTSLEGGLTAPAIDVLVDALRHLLKSTRRDILGLTDEELSKVEKLCDQLEEAAALDRVLGTRPSHLSFANFLETFIGKLKAIAVGQRLVFTGGWRHMKGGHAIMYVAEQTAQDEWSLAIANTGNGIQYHPGSPRFPKMLSRTVIVLSGIPSSRILSADFWAYVHKLRAFPQSNHGPQALYDVALPHLVDGFLPGEYDDAVVGDLETPQRAGTCYYRCVLSVSKYLLKREGFSKDLRKRLFFGVRVAYLDIAREHLGKVRPVEYFDSDRRIIQMAIEQTARAAVKELDTGRCINEKLLDGLREELEDLSRIANEKLGAEEDVMMGVDLGDVLGSPVAPFLGFELLADESDTDLLVGGAMEGTPSLAVDLLCPVTKAESFERVLMCINFCCSRTLQLFKKRGACATSLVMHQVCALVEHIFNDVVPVPTGKPGCVYLGASILRAQYMDCMSSLRQILAGYVAASHSRKGNAGTDSSRIVTASAILAVVDAVVHLRPTDQRSALAEALSKIDGPDTRPAFSRFNSEPVLATLESVMCCKPGELVTRDGVLRYFEFLGGTLFNWEMKQRVSNNCNLEVSEEDDPTLALVGRLIADLGLPDLPPEHAASEGRLLAWSRAAWQVDLQEVSVLQKRGRWFAHTWEELPEFADFRDIHFLFRVALEGTNALRSGNRWMPPSWGPAETMPRWIAFRDGGNVQFRVTTVNLEQDFTGLVSRSGSHGDITRLLPSSVGLHPNEEDILFTDALPSFEEMLSIEEAERLMTYLTAPHMAVPLIMQFFSQGRIGCLVKIQLRRLLDAVLFEAREYVAEPLPIEVVPVANEDRHACLGTRWGLLLQEVMYTPVAVLQPLAQMLRSAITLSLGDFRSSFVPVMLYMVRVATRILLFAGFAEDHDQLPTAALGTAEALELVKDIRKQLHLAAEQLRTWLQQSEAGDEVQTSINLCAHLVLLVEAEGGEYTFERWDRLVSAMAFVVSWHSKQAGSSGPSYGAPRGRFGGGYGGYGGGYNRRREVQKELAELDEVPVSECFAVFERRRPALLQWLASKPEELDVVLSHVAGAALNREVALPVQEGGASLNQGWRGWQAVDDKPLMCEVTLESPHPYRPSTDEYCHVRFPGAAYISLHFDDQCSTEKDHDYVTIYKDSSFSSTWGPAAELSGMGESTGNWPGVAGRPPLVVAADEFWLYFHSDASQESWGWKLTAFAPVNKEEATRLADLLAPPEAEVSEGGGEEADKERKASEASDGKTHPSAAVRLRAAQKALVACRNDLGMETRAQPLRSGQTSAQEYLERDAEKLLRQAAEELAEAPTQRSSGIFQDPTGSVEVSLQTCEVYLQQRMLMPTPSNIADHQDFLEALGLQNRDEIPFCAVRDRMANRTRVTLLHRDRTYEICRWSPLIPRSSGSLTETEKPVCGGLLDLPCYSIPRQEGDSLIFGGKKFTIWDYNLSKDEQDMELDSESWVQKCFSKVLLEAVDEAGLDELPVMWRAKKESEPAEGGAASKDIVFEEHFLMHVPASGSLEERKGHPGAIFEVMALNDRRLILVFALKEEARRLQRSLVWASDSGIALADLLPDVSERYTPWAPGTRYAAGNLFATLMSRKGELLPHPYLQAGSEDNPAHGTLCIRRANIGPTPAQRLAQKLQALDATAWGETPPAAEAFPGAEDWVSEVFVPKRCLQGLLPDALLEQFSFWRSGPLLIRGYPKEARTEMELVVKLQRMSNRSGPESCIAMVQRLHCPAEGQSEDPEALKGISARPALLLNPQLAHKGSPLWQISEALKRFESAGWVLYWTDAMAELGEEAACTLVELPRLRLRFSVRGGRLHSLEYAGLRVCKTVPDEVAQLCRGLPHALALENPVLGSLFVLTPNYEPKVIKIHVCPLNTELVLLRSEGFLQSPATRYYLYPVHTSGKFLQAPSVAAAFYLLLLRLLRREYLAATRILESCFSDVPFNTEERWLIDMLAETQSDKHPNAAACRLRLTLLLSELPGESQKFNASDDHETYSQSFMHVSQQCRLSLAEELLLIERCGLRNERRRYGMILQEAASTGEEPKSFSQGAKEPLTAGDELFKNLSQYSQKLHSASQGPYKAEVKLINGLRYKRPQSSRHDNVNSLQMVLDLCKDDVSGQRHQMGFGLLYDMAIGSMHFDWASSPSTETAEDEGEVVGEARDEKFASALFEADPPMFQYKEDDSWVNFASDMLQLLRAAHEVGGEQVEVSIGEKKYNFIFESQVLAPVDDAEAQPLEGKIVIQEKSTEVKEQEEAMKEALPVMAAPRRKPSSSTLAALLAKELLVNPKCQGNKDLLSLIICIDYLLQKGEANQMADLLPHWPYGKEEWSGELDKGIGSKGSEIGASFRAFDCLLRRAAGEFLGAEAWTSYVDKERPTVKAEGNSCTPEPWDEPVALSDCNLGNRTLSTISLDKVSLTEEEVRAMSTSPLEPVSQGVIRLAAAQADRCLAKLPFDLSGMPIAQTEMAESMLKRLAQDVEGARLERLTAKEPELCCLDAEAMAVVSGGGSRCRETLSNALQKVNELEDQLKAMLQVETTAVSEGVRATERVANEVNKERPGVLSFELSRVATMRAKLSFEALAAAVVSSKAAEDLGKINPFLAASDGWDIILQAVCTVLLRSVRVTQLRACLSAADALKKDISALLQALQAPPHSDFASAKMVTYALRAGDYEPSQVQANLDPLCKAVEDLSKQLQEQRTGLSSQKAIAIAQVCLEVCDWKVEKATEMLSKDPDSAVAVLERAKRRCTNKEGRPLPLPSPTSLAHSAAGSKELQGALRHALLHSSQHVASQVAAARHYMSSEKEGEKSTVSYDCRFLIFEYMVGFMLRRRQVELIRDFATDAIDGKSSVHQMIMGQGKTTVISPMLALLLADGNRLVTQVVPAELHEMSCSVLRACFQNVLKKRVYTLYFDRSSNSSNTIEPVRWLKMKLYSARKQGAIVCTSPGSVKSLLLKYVELLHMVSKAPEPLRCPVKDLGPMREKAETMASGLRAKELVADELAEIIRLWGPKGGGIALLDEVDLLTHPLKSELNYPIGPKLLLDGHEFRWDLPIFLLDGLFRVVTGELSVDVRPSAAIEATVNDITSAVRDGEANMKIMLRQEIELCLLQPAYYWDRFRDPLARWALVWLKEQADVEAAAQAVRQASHSGSAAEGESMLSEACVWQIFETYVSGRKRPEDVARLNVAPAAMRMLNLAREWITGFMPYVLSKVDRVSYGLLHPSDIDRWEELEGKRPEMPQSRLLLAVPFIGKDVPARNAEFAHPEVLIGLSILAYRYEGLRVADMKKVISALQAEMQYQPGPFTDRPARVLFQDWLGSAARSRMRSSKRQDGANEAAEDDFEVLPLELLKIEDDDQFSTAYKALRSHPPTVYYYLQKLVFPAVMRHQDQKLTASGVDLAGDMLFNVRLGFSGTPSDLLPPCLRPCHFEPGSEAEMLRVLTDHETLDYEVVPSPWSVETLLQRVANGQSRGGTGFAALIDCGALVTGLTNEEVARKLLQIGLEGIDAVVYLDASDAKMVVDRSGGRPVPLSRSGVPKERRFTFYDQVHTTGMDIKQGFDSCAVVTLGKDMTWRDYAQGCYRMRGLGKGQTLHVLIVSEIAELIHEISTTGDMLVDVVAWLLGNSMASEQLQSIALIGQCLSDTWRQRALAAMLPTKAPAQNKAYALTSRFWRHIEAHQVAATLARNTLLTQDEINQLEMQKLSNQTKGAISQLKLVLGSTAVADFERTYKYLMQNTARDELVRARLFYEKLVAFVAESGIAIDLPAEGAEERQAEEAERLRLRKSAAKKDMEIAEEQVAAVLGKEGVDEVIKPLKDRIKEVAKAATSRNGEGLRKGWSLLIRATEEVAEDQKIEADPAVWNSSLKFRFQVTIGGPASCSGLMEAYPGAWNEDLMLEAANVHGQLFFDPENESGSRIFKHSSVEGRVVFVMLTMTQDETTSKKSEAVKSADRAVRHAASAGARAVLFGCSDSTTSEAFGLDISKIPALIIRKPHPNIPAFVVKYDDAVKLQTALREASHAVDFTGGTRLTNPALTSAELVLYKPKSKADDSAPVESEGKDEAKEEENGDKKEEKQEEEASKPEGEDDKAAEAKKEEETKEEDESADEDFEYVRGRALMASRKDVVSAYKVAVKYGAHMLVTVAEGQDLFMDPHAEDPYNQSERSGHWWNEVNENCKDSLAIPAFALPQSAGENLCERLANGESLKARTSFSVPHVEEEVTLLEDFISWAVGAGFEVDCPNMRALNAPAEEASSFPLRVAVLQEDGSSLSPSKAADFMKSAGAFQNECTNKEVQAFYEKGMPYNNENEAAARERVKSIMAAHALRIVWAANEKATVGVEPDMTASTFRIFVLEALRECVRSMDTFDYALGMVVGELKAASAGGDLRDVPITVIARRPPESMPAPPATAPSEGEPTEETPPAPVLKTSGGHILEVIEGDEPLSRFGCSKEAMAKGDVEISVFVGISFTKAHILEAVNKLDSSSDLGQAEGKKLWEERKPRYGTGTFTDFICGLTDRSAGADKNGPEVGKDGEVQPPPPDPEFLQTSVKVFVEGLNLHLSSEPPLARPYYEVMEESMAQRADFLSRSPDGMKAAQAIIDGVKQSSICTSNNNESDELSRGMEVVQEQQQEEQKEKEKQKEKQIQSDFARNPADHVRWEVESLNNACDLLGSTFYAAACMKIGVRRPTSSTPKDSDAEISAEDDRGTEEVAMSVFPEQFLVSENFAPLLLHSDLPRRLKNVEVMLSWGPADATDVYPAEEDDPDLIRSCFALARETLRTIARPSTDGQRPRMVVCISLAEGEALRRRLAMRTSGGALNPQTAVALVSAISGLRLSPPDDTMAGGTSEAVVAQDSSSLERQLTPAENRSDCQVLQVEDLRQCGRFFDAQMWFAEDEVIQILRAVARCAESQRRLCFEALIGCKRRDRYSWESTPVAQVFQHADARTLQHLRGLFTRVRDELSRRSLPPTQAFALWDQNRDGWLSQSELGTALKALGLGLTDGDVAELLQHADVDGDGFLDYREFAAEFGVSNENEEDSPLLQKARKQRRAAAAPQKQSVMRQLQDLSGGNGGEETESSAAPLPKGVSLDGAVTNWRGLAALGTMYLTSGGHVQFHGDGRVSTQPGYRPSIKPRGVNLTSGCWYWELTVSVVGRASVGWATSEFHGNSAMARGVGDDEHSWGIDGYTQQLYGWGRSTPYGFCWGPGDVIGISVDIGKGEMQWSLNGSTASPMGKAADRLPASAAAGLAPAVSFDSAFQFHINLGQSPFRFRPPESYRSVWSWVSGVQERQHAVLSGGRFAKFQCTSGQAGVTIKDDILTFTQGFPSVTLAGCLLTRGKWYYEFENVSPSRCPQIGWADLDFIGASRSGVGVGDDKHSWGYDGGRAPRQGLWADGYVNYGEHWNTGDVTGAAADLEGRRLSFSLNGSWERPMGVAVESANFTVGITPGITAQAYGVIRVNLGERPFKYAPPPGHRGVYEWIQGMRSVLSLQRAQMTPMPPPVALFRAHSAAVQPGGLAATGSSASGTAPPSPRHAEEVKLRVSSGYAHANLDRAEGIVSARDNYPSVVAEVLLFKGSWVYEVEIVQLGFADGERPSNTRRMRGATNTSGEVEAFIGWADKRFFGDYVRGIGVGDDRHSWGWRCAPQTAVQGKHAGSLLPVEGDPAARLNTGDVLTLSMNLQTGRACLFVNSILRGTLVDVTPAVGLMPAVSLWPGTRLKLNFGSRLVHLAALKNSANEPAPPLAGYRPVSEWSSVHMPAKLPEGLQLQRMSSGQQGPSLRRAISSGGARLDLSSAGGSGSRQLASLMAPAAQAAEPSQELPSSRSELCLQQLRIASQMALCDGVADDDAELQGLLKQLLEHTGRRLGAHQHLQRQ